MRRSLLLLGFVLAVFFCAALLAPPVYWATQSLSGSYPGNSFLKEIASKPFPKYVSRTALVCALICLVPVVRMLRIRWRDVGVSKPDWPRLGRGALLAFVTLGALIALAFWFDARDWRRATPDRVWRAISAGLQAAIVVSVLEELIFRGALFGLLRSGTRWLPALVVSSTVFAVVHFLQSPEAHVGTVEWHSGFNVLAAMLFPSNAEPTRLIQFLNLWLCGAILALAYQRTGNLWFSIGLHGGWIFWLKFANSVTTTSPEAAAWWGTRKVIDGWNTTILLAVTGLITAFLTRPRPALKNATAVSTSVVG